MLQHTSQHIRRDALLIRTYWRLKKTIYSCSSRGSCLGRSRNQITSLKCFDELCITRFNYWYQFSIVISSFSICETWYESGPVFLMHTIMKAVEICDMGILLYLINWYFIVTDNWKILISYYANLLGYGMIWRRRMPCSCYKPCKRAEISG